MHAVSKLKTRRRSSAREAVQLMRVFVIVVVVGLLAIRRMQEGTASERSKINRDGGVSIM